GNEVGALAPPLADWGGGDLNGSIILCAPSLSLQPKSDLSDFGQLISGRTRVNPSSAASGGGDAGAQSPRAFPFMPSALRRLRRRQVAGECLRHPLDQDEHVGMLRRPPAREHVGKAR